MIQLRKVSAKPMVSTSSNSNNTSEVQASRPRETSADQTKQRYGGASAYIDQSEYDSFKPPTIVSKPEEPARGAYSNYTQTNTNDNNKTRQVYHEDKNENDYPDEQHYPQQYSKPSSTNYPGLIGRSGSYNNLQANQTQPVRIASGKQRNPSAGSGLYQVKIF